MGTGILFYLYDSAMRCSAVRCPMTGSTTLHLADLPRDPASSDRSHKLRKAIWSLAATSVNPFGCLQTTSLQFSRLVRAQCQRERHPCVLSRVRVEATRSGHGQVPQDDRCRPRTVPKAFRQEQRTICAKHPLCKFAAKMRVALQLRLRPNHHETERPHLRMLQCWRRQLPIHETSIERKGCRKAMRSDCDRTTEP
jgi:hypothetical protein